MRSVSPRALLNHMTQPGSAQWALARLRQADEAAAELEDCSPPRANDAAGGRTGARLQGSPGRGAAGARRADERSDGHGGAGGRTERGGAAGTFNRFGEAKGRKGQLPRSAVPRIKKASLEPLGQTELRSRRQRPSARTTDLLAEKGRCPFSAKCQGDLAKSDRPRP